MLMNRQTSMKVVTLVFLLIPCASAFKVYWNVPTFQCRTNYKMDFVQLLRTYGLFVNEEDKFQGANITIFYESQLGLYPYIQKSGNLENGGIPQKGNLEKHLQKAELDINKVISQDFDGLGIIDWESWRPTWEFNWSPLNIYQDSSIELVKKQNPNMADSEVKKIAELQWEKAARSYMLETLLLAKKMRPRGEWCYYLFPDCYNYVGKKPKDFYCSDGIIKGNNKLSWLWEQSTALCPSIYVYASYFDRYTLEQRAWRDNGKLKEAFRVASPKAKIYPYINYYLVNQLVPEDDFWRMMAQTAAAGADGAVIWGSSASVNSEHRCKDLKQYIMDVLGPATEKISWKSDLCKKTICNNRGRCTWPRDENVQAWKLFLKDTSDVGFKMVDIVCRCSGKYTGRFCEKEE